MTVFGGSSEDEIRVHENASHRVWFILGTIRSGVSSSSSSDWQINVFLVLLAFVF